MPTYKLQPGSRIAFIYRGKPLDIEADDDEHVEEIIQEYILDYGELYSWDVDYEEVDEE